MTAPRGRDTSPIITLTTDFGLQDGYVGAMQGVILSICPTATIIHLSHHIPPQEVHAAAFVLYQAFGFYPPQTVHCAVVDPGVGSRRRAVAVRTNCGIFVGPDNGVFSLVTTAEGINVQEAVTLTNPDYQLPAISATFHGRDIFAPAAAHIARGVPLCEFGPSAINLVQLDAAAGSKQTGPSKAGRISHIDRFGNLILDLTASDIENTEEVTFKIGDQVIKSLSYTFTDVPMNQLLAYLGSTRGHVEIAVRNGNAAQRLGVKVGDVVKVNDGL